MIALKNDTRGKLRNGAKKGYPVITLSVLVADANTIVQRILAATSISIAGIVGKGFTNTVGLRMNLKLPVIVVGDIMRYFVLYLLRWQLSTPILWCVMAYLGSGIWGTVAANLLGGLMFYGVDQWIFRK